MQRFKKFVMIKGNVDAQHQPVIFGRRHGFGLVAGADALTGRFVYGANGTRAYGASCRAAIAIAQDCTMPLVRKQPQGFGRRVLAASVREVIRVLLAEAKHDGCRLPA